MREDRQGEGTDRVRDVLAEEHAHDGECQERGDRRHDEAPQDDQSERPGRETEHRQNGSDTDVPAKRGRGALATAKASEDRRYLPEDRREGTQVTAQLPDEHGPRRSRYNALEQIDDEHRDPRQRPHRQGDIRRPGVTRSDRPGVRTASQSCRQDSRRNAPDQVAGKCSQRR